MELSNDQRHRIEENRRKAQARLLERRLKRDAVVGSHEADASGKGQGRHGKPIDDNGAAAVSSVQCDIGVSRSRDTGDSETAEGVLPDGASGMRSRGSSLEVPGPESVPAAAVATASSSPGFHRDGGSWGMGGAGVARGTRTGGGGREVTQESAGARAGGAKEEEIDATSMATETATETATCEACAKSDAFVDQELLKGFDVSVCRSCKLSREDYQCVTKKDAKETYLLPEGTIAVLKFVERDNPHHSSWNKMKLYLRRHVTEYSYKRWGGEAGLEAERRRRDALKYNRTLARTKGVFKRGKSNNGAAYSSATYYDDDE